MSNNIFSFFEKSSKISTISTGILNEGLRPGELCKKDVVALDDSKQRTVQHQFDAYVKKALRGEVNDHKSELARLSSHETLFSELPDGMLDNILSYIKSIDEGLIEKVYLVKKIITDDFSTSVVIIRFAPETDEEKRAEIYKKIFVYLDTSSNHQFSLFDYAGVSSVKFEKIAGSCVFDIKKAE